MTKQQPEFTPEADAELEACLAWLRANQCGRLAENLYKHRRPTVGKKAWEAFDRLAGYTVVPEEQYEAIRCALETLIALENGNDK